MNLLWQLVEVLRHRLSIVHQLPRFRRWLVRLLRYCSVERSHRPGQEGKPLRVVFHRLEAFSDHLETVCYLSTHPCQLFGVRFHRIEGRPRGWETYRSSREVSASGRERNATPCDRIRNDRKANIIAWAQSASRCRISRNDIRKVSSCYRPLWYALRCV